MHLYPVRAMQEGLDDSRRARRISSELGLVLIDTLGLAATVEWHVRKFQKRTGIRCDLALNDAAGFKLPEDCAETIFDIYNEALSNVARHAGASRVAVALTVTPQEITMVVRDNGIGLAGKAPVSGAGGLAAIRARTQAHKGICEIACAPYAGTAVTVSLPIA
jgi:signal transduction histidine kinase